jgi:hypothetical protein
MRGIEPPRRQVRQENAERRERKKEFEFFLTLPSSLPPLGELGFLAVQFFDFLASTENVRAPFRNPGE